VDSETLPVIFSSFTLIGLAEIGDKSQLVCMTLAARHRHWPVLLGAMMAFVVLNTLAVVFGASIAAWLPESLIVGLVALLFGFFGIHSLFFEQSEEEGDLIERSGANIFTTTLVMIIVAEFGDKTQIAVAGMAGSMAPVPVWIGATGALVLVSGLGVWLGRTLLQRLPLRWLHRVGGGGFLVFAMIAVWHLFR
jgi:Ca2+/H+ antiporter, TMEM165/GDT1 family